MYNKEKQKPVIKPKNSFHQVFTTYHRILNYFLKYFSNKFNFSGRTSA